MTKNENVRQMMEGEIARAVSLLSDQFSVQWSQDVVDAIVNVAVLKMTLLTATATLHRSNSDNP